MLSNLLSSGGRMAVYCPQWVYAACVGLTARDFLVKDIPIDLMARRYSKALLEKYDEVNPIEISSIAEDIIRILADVEAGSDASKYLDGFIYYTINYDNGKLRNRKPLLGSIFDGERDRFYEERDIVKMFKSYMYALRSDLSKPAPTGWKIDDEEDIDFLRDMATEEFTIFDAISLKPSDE